MVSSMYSFGQILSDRPFSSLSNKISFKVLMLIQMLVSCVGALFLGVFPTFYGLFLFRFFGGIGSNTQTLIRKLFFGICFVEKQSWHQVVYKLLWATRMGGFLGIVLAGLLSNSSLFISKPTKSMVERWFLPSLTLFLLYILGLFFVFSIDTNFLSSFTGLNYQKMKEVPEKTNEADQSPEDQTKDSQKEGEFNFKRFLENKFEVPDEKEENKEEKTVSDEIKYYSPKHIANKSSCFKAPMSARINLASKESAETIEEPQYPKDIKKTHISFIEDDMIDLPSNETTEVPLGTNENEEKPRPSLYLASVYRVLETAVISLVIDSIPYTLIFSYPDMTLMQLSAVLAAAHLASSLLTLALTPKLNKRLPYSFTNPAFITLLIIFLTIQASFSLFPPILPLHLLTLTPILLSCDLISPLGCILISDSVNSSERDLALKKSSLHCSITKLLCACLSPCAVFILHPLSLYSASILLSTLLLWFSKVLSRRYQFLNKAPYQI